MNFIQQRPALALAIASVLVTSQAQAAPNITSVLVTSNASGTPTSIGINGSGLCATTNVATCTGYELAHGYASGALRSSSPQPHRPSRRTLPLLAAGTYTLVLVTAGSCSIRRRTTSPLSRNRRAVAEAYRRNGAQGATGAARG
jgi:hypothetical protein